MRAPWLTRLGAERRGVTALEYAVIGAVVVGAVAAAFGSYGSALSTSLDALLTAAPPAATAPTDPSSTPPSTTGPSSTPSSGDGGRHHD